MMLVTGILLLSVAQFLSNVSAHPAATAAGNSQKQSQRRPGVHYKRTALETKLFAAPQLTYQGGPINANVEVHPIYYGEAKYQDGLNAFYTAVVNSTYFDWLSEYNTPTQKLGRGSFGTVYKETKNLSTHLDDTNDIQPYLYNLVKAGILNPTPNTYYPIHIAPGISVTLDGVGDSCYVFCAYHGTIDVSKISKSGTQYLYYGVIPDQDGLCASGCGYSSIYENTCSVSSHELIEMVTDAAVGVGELAWYDNVNGEIGDICNGQQGKVVGGDGNTYTVQTEWSNKLGKCIVQTSGPKPSPKVSTSVLPIPSSTKTTTTTTSTTKKTSSTLTPTQSAPVTTTTTTTTTTSTTSKTTTSSWVPLPPSPSPTNTCPHDKCKQGPPLPASCDPCVAMIAGDEPFCTESYWDYMCVRNVYNICGIICGSV